MSDELLRNWNLGVKNLNLSKNYANYSKLLQLAKGLSDFKLELGIIGQLQYIE